ncbi:Peptidase S10, serine carboxypeptidase, partial [Sesbania bispinosa]
MTPFQALYGRSPPGIPDYVPGSSTIGSLDATLQKRTQIMSALRENLKRSRQRMVEQANKHRQDRTFAPGDWGQSRSSIARGKRGQKPAVPPVIDAEKSTQTEQLEPSDRDASSQSLICATRGRPLGGVSKVPAGQRASSQAAPQPFDQSVVRSGPLPESTIHVPTFSPPKTGSEALDLLPFPQARSQPSKDSSIRVPPQSPSKAPSAPLDVFPFSQERSQPPMEASIRVESQNTNLEDKDDEVATSWLNNHEVRRAIHTVKESVVSKWSSCASQIDYYHDTGSMIDYHKNLTSKGYRALVY